MLLDFAVVWPALVVPALTVTVTVREELEPQAATATAKATVAAESSIVVCGNCAALIGRVPRASSDFARAA